MSALLLLAENVLALYYSFSGSELPFAAVEAMLALQSLETAAIAFLVYVSVQWRHAAIAANRRRTVRVAPQAGHVSASTPSRSRSRTTQSPSAGAA
ncbi:hypothetical protein ACFQFH_12575 [Halobaculum halobium]|uniref:Uncharacterized protein n=1 Tax=Halobaculum halobium TaxID=3032281 RepID=A0ABD5TBN7_9EURY|nr:hypothetical protein [Halobaculum sp. SYNS20]